MANRPYTRAASAPRRSRARGLAAAAALLLTLAPISGSPLAVAEPNAGEAPWLEEAAARLDVDFVHRSGRAGRYRMPEVMGPGVAVFDADGDSDLDLFFVQGGDFEHPAPGDAKNSHRLYLNQLVESGRLGFRDATAASGLQGCAYGMGVTAGDYDGDGRVDLYVTCAGSNQLWHNEGVEGQATPRFRDVTAATGADDDRWSVSAAFFDYDRDGRLDLYVGNYLKLPQAAYRVCKTPAGEADWCGPVRSEAVPGRLLHNRGNGTFEDVTAKAGLDAEFGPGLGARVFDFDGDGWLDLYVANDETQNQLWLNRGDGTFRNDALLAGCALSGEGATQASMGIDAGDVDDDGDLDVAITNLDNEGITLYRTGAGLCEDASISSGLRARSLAVTGFGAGWLDVDADGRLDLLTVNGAVKVLDAQVRAKEPLPLRQPRQLFRNLDGGRFEEVSARAGAAFVEPEVGRGAAFADLDNDGDTDVVVAGMDGPARVFLDRIADGHAWLGLRLVTATGPAADAPLRDALGALVTLEREGAPPLVRQARADGSYASANDPRVIFSLAGAGAPRRVLVRWPSGRKEAFPAPQAGRYTTLREGGGAAP